MVFILLSSLISMVSAQSLPKFLAKQGIEDLRYISDDGKATYYQAKQGTLNMTFNYKNVKVLNLVNDTHFLIHNQLGGKILIEADQTYNSKLTLDKNNQIYLTDVGAESATLVAEGRNPRLELDGNWMSYYSPSDKSVVFQNLLTDSGAFRLKLKYNNQPFVTPRFNMLDDKNVFYTDLNPDHHLVLLHYNKTDKKYLTVYKTKFPGSTIEFCRMGNQFIIMERGLFNTDNGTQIVSVPLFQNKDYRKKDLLYSSTLNDIGGMVCRDEFLYFVKTTEFDSFLQDKSTEVAKLTLKEKKLEIISKFGNVTSLVSLGNRLLAKFKQDYYLVEGKNDATSDALDSKQP